MVHIFIVNPYAGKKNFADDLRARLKGLDDSNLKYYIFNTRYPGHEAELMRYVMDIFDEDNLRIYSCGGSGTFRNVISKVSEEELSRIEFALYPCGISNDFLKIFSANEQARFNDIYELINGEVKFVDYIKSNDGNAINTFSHGLDSKTTTAMEGMRFLQLIGENVPYNLSVLYGMFSGRQAEYIIETEFGTFDGKFMEVYFGNGNILGGNMFFFNSADVTDGRADVRLMRCKGGFDTIPYVSALLKNDQQYLNKKTISGRSSFIKIRTVDGKPMSCNHDGELKRGSNRWEAHIVKGGLKFVVPKGTVYK